MTTGNWMVQNSTLDIGEAWNHLVNPSGDGGGGTILTILGYTVAYDSKVYTAIAPEESLEILVVSTDVIAIYEPKEATIEVGYEPTVIIKEC